MKKMKRALQLSTILLFAFLLSNLSGTKTCADESSTVSENEAVIAETDPDLTSAVLLDPMEPVREISVTAGQTYLYRLNFSRPGDYYFRLSSKEDKSFAYTRYDNGNQYTSSTGYNYPFTGNLLLSQGKDICFSITPSVDMTLQFYFYVLTDMNVVSIRSERDNGNYSYDPIEKELVLNNYSGRFFGIWNLACITGNANTESQTRPLTIRIEGENRIRNYSGVNLLQISGFHTTFTGDGILYLEAPDSSLTGISAIAGSVTFDGPTIYYKGSDSLIYVWDGVSYPELNHYNAIKDSVVDRLFLKSGNFIVEQRCYTNYDREKKYENYVFAAQEGIKVDGGNIRITYTEDNEESKPISVFGSTYANVDLEDGNLNVTTPEGWSNIPAASAKYDPTPPVVDDDYTVEEQHPDPQAPPEQTPVFTLTETQFPYTGSEIKPEVVCTPEKIKGLDYYIVYENNIEPGEASVIIKGLTKNYTQTLPFEILSPPPAPEPEPGSQSGETTETEDDTTETTDTSEKMLRCDDPALSVSDLKVGVLILDAKGNAVYKITKLTRKKGNLKGGKLTYVRPYKKDCKTVTVKDQLKLVKKTFKVTAIGGSAFDRCKKLKTVKIKGKSLKKITKKSFRGCRKGVKLRVHKKLVKKYKTRLKKLKLQKKYKVGMLS